MLKQNEMFKEQEAADLKQQNINLKALVEKLEDPKGKKKKKKK